ncbi:major facilitator superfamily domain-containing protein [Aspergillus alliaceus]|uniref:major facilitator superfamily domain-containing protein n=1 Tax=Petromyces alliaceus TaxID=209559 RepID=UPI0012A4B1C7|nr:major facilitator superfamily domain-containing protein [Aspergillus alliaceus]KAB8231523.1 major facilitator superfamily domain-containing protein [Aspergillus alliaceus]
MKDDGLEITFNAGKFYQPLVVSIWELGEGVGSFMVGPLSEHYGRNIIYYGGNLLFILCSVAAALSPNISVLVAFRFFNDMAVTSLIFSPPPQERGAAMALGITLPLIGPCVAPNCESPSSGFLLQSIVRPVRLLFSSPMLLVMALYTVLTHGISYLILTMLSEIIPAIGNIVGPCFYGLISDRYAKHRGVIEGEFKPEQRLPLMVFGTAMLLIGLTLYIYMLLAKPPTENYLVDTFDKQRVSAFALSANATPYALSSGPSFPSPAHPRITHSVGWGNSLLAFLSLAFLSLFTALWLRGEGFRKLGWGYL